MQDGKMFIYNENYTIFILYQFSTTHVSRVSQFLEVCREMFHQLNSMTSTNEKKEQLYYDFVFFFFFFLI